MKKIDNRYLLDIVAKNIRAHRRRMHLSQEALAEKADLHRTYIGMVERSEKNITLLSLQRISWALNVPVIDLLEEKK